MSLGLCLAGGGIKGAAHIGVIKALEEEKIKIDYISGTSSGSILATMYAIGYTTDEMYKIFKKYSKEINYISLNNIIKLVYGIFIKKKVIIKSINNGKKFRGIINEICCNKNIKNIRDIKMPLLIPSVDLNTGTICVFSSIDFRETYSDNVIYDSNISIEKAIYASCTYPGVFEPIQYNGMYLIDGGTRENIPWRETKRVGADEVLSVIFQNEIKDVEERHIINIVTGAMELLSHELANYEVEGTDHLIKIITKNVSLLNSKEIDYLYQKGYSIGKESIKNIKFKHTNKKA